MVCKESNHYAKIINRFYKGEDQRGPGKKIGLSVVAHRQAPFTITLHQTFNKEDNMTVGNFNTSTAINQLVRVSESKIGSEFVNSVDARELHLFLESKQQFADWISAKVLDNPFFEEGIDYALLQNVMKQTGRGGHNKKDYVLTQDTAKKVSMAEQTVKGNEARDYFLECERVSRRVKAPAQIPETVQCQLMGAETIARMLNYSDASKIDIVSRVYKANNISSSFLPEYVENVKVVFSATELLKRTGTDMSIREFNKLLLSAGYLEEKVRPSSKGVSKFKALTDKGLKYGQNDVSPHSKLQVQPHFFEYTFGTLFSELTK